MVTLADGYIVYFLVNVFVLGQLSVNWKGLTWLLTLPVLFFGAPFIIVHGIGVKLGFINKVKADWVLSGISKDNLRTYNLIFDRKKYTDTLKAAAFLTVDKVSFVRRDIAYDVLHRRILSKLTTFGIHDIAQYRGVWYEIDGVDFEESLLCLDMGEQTWVRFESITDFKHQESMD